MKNRGNHTSHKSKKLFLLSSSCKIIVIIAFALLFKEEISAAYNGEQYLLSNHYRETYLEDNSIEIYDFNRENKKLEKAYKKYENSNMIGVQQVKKIGEGTYWKKTKENTDFYYVGKLKNNKPVGYGFLYKKIYAINLGISMDLKEVYYAKIYEGQFENGKISGYGKEYLAPLDEMYYDGKNTEVFPYAFYAEVSEEIQENIFETANPLVYEGYFKNGKYSGQGNKYEYDVLNWIVSEEELSNKKKADPGHHITVYTGEFSKGKEHGNIKIFMNGFLLYNGDVKKGVISGNGTSYYPKSTQVHYKGMWKNNKYDGKGKEYSENGKLLYSGNWNEGDYAE